MADKKISELTEKTTLADDDLFALVDSATAPIETKKIKRSTLTAQLQIRSPRGYLLNGKIVPSVAANNLTVAIKGLDGNDPSSTNPVYCRIGDTIRSITTALSVTKNAGTNWFNAGSAELATREIDYFVYLGYNATDGVVIGFSRIPFACEYSQFSATTTNEKYCAISTITNAVAGDDYEVIGRFAATLSAGAGYTWTVPTFTNINLIQRPIYTTRWLVWLPTYTALAPMTYADTLTGTYSIHMNTLSFALLTYGTTGGVASVSISFSIPYSTTLAAFNFGTGCLINDGAGVNVAGFCQNSGVNTIELRRYDGANYGIGAARGGAFAMAYQIS